MTRRPAGAAYWVSVLIMMAITIPAFASMGVKAWWPCLLLWIAFVCGMLARSDTLSGRWPDNARECPHCRAPAVVLMDGFDTCLHCGESRMPE